MERMRNAPQWGDLSVGNLEWKGGKTINPLNKYWKGRKKERDFILLHHWMSWAWTGEKIYLFVFPWGSGSVNRWEKGWKIQIPNRKGQGTVELYFEIQWYSGHSWHWAWFLIRFAVVYGWELCKFPICWKYAWKVSGLLQNAPLAQWHSCNCPADLAAAFENPTGLSGEQLPLLALRPESALLDLKKNISANLTVI